LEIPPPVFQLDGGRRSKATWTNLPELGKLIPKYDAEVLDIHSITTEENCWGPVESCRIVLRGVVCFGELGRSNEGTTSLLFPR
jgi:hypothetical protein